MYIRIIVIAGLHADNEAVNKVTSSSIFCNCYHSKNIFAPICIDFWSFNGHSFLFVIRENSYFYEYYGK